MMTKMDNEPGYRYSKPVKCCISRERVSKSHQYDAEFSYHGVT